MDPFKKEQYFISVTEHHLYNGKTIEDQCQVGNINEDYNIIFLLQGCS